MSAEMRLRVSSKGPAVHCWPLLCCFVLAVALRSAVKADLADSSPRETSSEVGVLEEFFHATSGPQWRSNRGWLQNRFPCGTPASDGQGGTEWEVLPWKGVRCDRNAHVVALTLPMNDLQGTLPASLSDLSHLCSLDVALNALSSTIPTSLLSPRASTHRGSKNLSDSPPLVSIDVSYNQLEIALEEMQSERLLSLDAGWNARLSGQLSDIALSVPNLEELHLDHMDLAGSSLNSLGQLHRLHAVSLSDCAIGAPLQTLNSCLLHLRVLDLSRNALSGTLPSNWTCNFPSLEILHLNGNHLEGAAPNFFESCKSNGACVEEDAKSASAEIDAQTCFCPPIIELDIADNAFSSFQSENFNCDINEKPRASPTTAENEYSAESTLGLRSLKLSGNEFASRIDVAALLRIFSRTLKTFECASCALPGRLRLLAQESQTSTPAHPISVLETLRLENNNLIGQLNPDILCSFSLLRTIGLHGNFFSGSFPSCLLHLQSVESIDLSSNKLTSFEAFDTECVSSLRGNVSTGNNIDSGDARRCLGTGDVHVSESLLELRLNDNYLQGTIPLGALRTISKLDFADNNFFACDSYGSTVEPGCSNVSSCFSHTLGQGFETTVNLCGNFKSLLWKHGDFQCDTRVTCEQPALEYASWLTTVYPHFPIHMPRRKFRICGTRNAFFAQQLVAHGWREVPDDGGEAFAPSDDAWVAAYGACYGDADNPVQRLGSKQLVSRFDDLSSIADKGKLSTNIAIFAAAVKKLQQDRLRATRGDSVGSVDPQKHSNTNTLRDRTSLLGFYPKSYVLPRDMDAWVLDMNAARTTNETLFWLLKPRAQCCGRGIRLVSEPPTEVMTRSTGAQNQWYVQQFVHPPKLVSPGGQKFVFRLFVLVTSLSPLRVYLYNNGLVFYSRPEAPYTASVSENVGKNADNATSLDANETTDKRRYITDYFFTEMQLRHAMTTRKLLQQLFQGANHSRRDEESRINASIQQLWSRVRQLTSVSLLAAQDDLAAAQRRHPQGGTRAGAFEVLGLDVAFDEHMQPYLCEINSAPNMGLEVNRVDAARDWEGYLRLRRWDTLYKQRLLAAALDLAGVQPAWMKPVNSTRDIFESPQRPHPVGSDAFKAPSPFMRWVPLHARVNATFIVNAFGLGCHGFDVVASPQLCLDVSDMHYLQQIHSELLRLEWFSFRPSSGLLPSSSDEFLVEDAVPLDNDVDVDLDRFEPVFPCVACLDHELPSGNMASETDQRTPRTTILNLRLRSRRRTLLGNWWHEVFAAVLELHQNCSTADISHDGLDENTFSKQMPQCFSLPKSLRWHDWMPMRHMSPLMRQVIFSSEQPEITVSSEQSNDHDDHCHVQQCHVDLARLAPQGATSSKIDIADRYCKFERSKAQRVECLVRRRGGVNYWNASNSSAQQSAPTPWRLQPQPWADLQRGLLFVKNMKTGSSTLKTILNKWVVSRTKGVHATPHRQGGRSKCHAGHFCLVVEEQPLSRLAIRGGVGVATGHEREFPSLVEPGFFWVTTVRHPVARAKSYFEHSLRNALRCLVRSDDNLLQHGNGSKCGASHLLHGFRHFWTMSTASSAPPAFAAAPLRDRLWDWMDNGLSAVSTSDATTKLSLKVDPMYQASIAQQAVDQFDMVLVCCEGSTFDDSLLVLHLQLVIPVADMLYTISKRFPNCAASASNLSGQRRQRYLALCEQAMATNTVGDPVEDIEKANPHDMEIYRYALGRLNATMQVLEPHFSRARERFRRIRLRSQSVCHRYFPTFEDGLGDEGGPLLVQRQACLESFCASDSECTAGLFV